MFSSGRISTGSRREVGLVVIRWIPWAIFLIVRDVEMGHIHARAVHEVLATIGTFVPIALAHARIDIFSPGMPEEIEGASSPLHVKLSRYLQP